jgi:CheY-like chemotaxis protein
MASVLIAEDNEALRVLYAVWLQSAGHRVTLAADGREALAAIEAGPPPDAAVLDVSMPYVDGLTVCRFLREREPAARIVVVSALEDLTDRAARAGADLAFGKPCERQDLLAAVADHPASHAA